MATFNIVQEKKLKLCKFLYFFNVFFSVFFLEKFLFFLLCLGPTWHSWVPETSYVRNSRNRLILSFSILNSYFYFCYKKKKVFYSWILLCVIFIIKKIGNWEKWNRSEIGCCSFSFYNYHNNKKKVPGRIFLKTYTEKWKSGFKGKMLFYLL